VEATQKVRLEEPSARGEGMNKACGFRSRGEFLARGKRKTTCRVLEGARLGMPMWGGGRNLLAVGGLGGS